MSRTISPVSASPMVCLVWRLARSGVYRHRVPRPDIPPQRRGPVGAMPDGRPDCGHSRRHRRQPVLWRRPSQDLGTAAPWRHTHLPAAGAAADTHT